MPGFLTKSNDSTSPLKGIRWMLHKTISFTKGDFMTVPDKQRAVFKEEVENAVSSPRVEIVDCFCNVDTTHQESVIMRAHNVECPVRECFEVIKDISAEQSGSFTVCLNRTEEGIYVQVSEGVHVSDETRTLIDGATFQNEIIKKEIMFASKGIRSQIPKNDVQKNGSLSEGYVAFAIEFNLEPDSVDWLSVHLGSEKDRRSVPEFISEFISLGEVHYPYTFDIRSYTLTDIENYDEKAVRKHSQRYDIGYSEEDLESFLYLED